MNDQTRHQRRGALALVARLQPEKVEGGRIGADAVVQDAVGIANDDGVRP
jgi:hypothetical protein